MPRRLDMGASLLALAVLIAGAVGVVMARERHCPQTALDERLLYFSSGDLLEKVALSYDALLADVYWIRAIQHYGGDRLNPESIKRYELLYPLLDLTTSLDPRFTIAYRFGAIFLSEPYPGGAGRPDLAVALLEKGIRSTPDRWEYYHDIGFVQYWHLHDYRKAAEWFARGGDRPGAPWWLRTYAAIMLTRGGDRQASRAMWQNMLQLSDNDWLRQNAQLRLMQLDALDQIDYLQRLVQEFEHRMGDPPSSWGDLVAARLLPRPPVDPAGTAYVLNRETGAIALSGSSPIHPLPTEPLPGMPPLERSAQPQS